MVKVTLPNDTVTTLEYDDLGRLTALVNAKSLGGETITSYAYTYKNDGVHSGLGQVERITHEDGRFATFSYDAHERLTTEHYKTPQDATLFRFDYAYDDDGNRIEKKHDYDPQTGTTKIVWFSDETNRTTIDDNGLGPSNQLKRMWTQGTNTTGTKHTVCGSFQEENIDTIEVVSKTTGDTQVDSATAQIRDGLFIARALNFYDGSNLATKATATATDLAENTVNTTNTGIDLDTSLDVWYTYDAAGRREYKYEAGDYQSGDPYTQYYWNDAGYLKQVDIDYGTGETPRYARAWLTWDPTGQLVKLEIRTGSSLGSLSPGSGGTLVYLTKWTYFGGAVIVEREEVGDASEKEYVSVAGAYLYQVDASSDYWYYHYDGNASVAAITDASGNISALYEYDSFGNKLTNAGTVDNAFGFCGGTLLERLGLLNYGGPGFYHPESAKTLASAGRWDDTVPPAAFLLPMTVICAGVAARYSRRRSSGSERAVFVAAIIVGCMWPCSTGEAGRFVIDTDEPDYPGSDHEGRPCMISIEYWPDAGEQKRCDKIGFVQLHRGYKVVNIAGVVPFFWPSAPIYHVDGPDPWPWYTNQDWWIKRFRGTRPARMYDDPGPIRLTTWAFQQFRSCAVCVPCGKTKEEVGKHWREYVLGCVDWERASYHKAGRDPFPRVEWQWFEEVGNPYEGAREKRLRYQAYQRERMLAQARADRDLRQAMNPYGYED